MSRTRVVRQIANGGAVTRPNGAVLAQPLHPAGDAIAPRVGNGRQVIQIRRTVNGSPPTGLAEGELAVQMGTAGAPQLWVGVPAAVDASGRRLIADLSDVVIDCGTW